MAKRQRRKKNTLRGHRTHGGGNKKNRRGKGVRGGVGKAGSHKHKFSKYYTEFGVKQTLKPKPKQWSVNIDFIHSKLEHWVTSGKVKKDGELFVIDGKQLGFGKVLGRGSITEKIRLENAKASGEAARKIVAAGGVVPDFEGTVEEEFEVGEEAGKEENDE